MPDPTQPPNPKTHPNTPDTLKLTLTHSNNRQITITGTWTGLQINSINNPIHQTPNQTIDIIPGE